MKEANEFLEKYLFEFLDDKGYIYIIVDTKGTISGFSKRNYHKVPKPILRNNAKKRLWKLKDAHEFLESYVGDKKQDYQDLSLNDFVTKTNMCEKIKPGEKLALFYLLYPDIFYEKEAIIGQNIEKGLPPLHGIVELSLETKLQSISSLIRSQLSDELIGFISNHPMPEETVLTSTNSQWEILKDLLMSQPLPNPGNGHYIDMYQHSMEELADWSNSELVAFIELLMLDITCLSNKTSEEKQRELQNLEIACQKERRRSEKYKKQIQETERKLTVIKAELNDAKSNYKNLTKKYQNQSEHNKELIEQNKRNVKTIAEIKVQNEQLTKKHEQMVQNQKNIIEPKLFDSEVIYLLSKVKNDCFTKYFTKEQVVYISDPLKLLEEIQTLNKQAIYFINHDGMTTKETFQLDMLLQKNELIYRAVNGGPKEIIRKIIYYLESELRYEVKEKN